MIKSLPSGSIDPIMKHFKDARKAVRLAPARKEAIRNNLSRIMGAREKMNGKLVERRAHKRTGFLALVKRLRKAQ